MVSHRVALIPSDALGREVVPEGTRSPDMGGRATTSDVGKSIAAVVTSA